jgi:hypothetical protein
MFESPFQYPPLNEIPLSAEPGEALDIAFEQYVTAGICVIMLQDLCLARPLHTKPRRGM